MPDEHAKVERNRENIECLQYVAVINGVCLGILTILILILGPLGIAYPKNSNSCPQEVCSSLSNAMSSAISKTDMDSATKPIWEETERLSTLGDNIDKSLKTKADKLFRHVDDLQWQINNIQDGRCACNVSHFCSKDQCEKIEQKLDQRVLGSCEGENQVMSINIQTQEKCSGYTILVPGYYQIIAESSQHGKLSVHVDNAVIFTQFGQYLAIFEPMVKGDNVFFSVNGTRVTPAYTSISLASKEDPSSVVPDHRARRDKMYAPGLLEVNLVVTQGWSSTLFFGFLWLIAIVIVLGLVGAGVYYTVTVLIPKYKNKTGK